MPSHCGSEPARDGGVSVDIHFECSTAIASRLAPTGDVGCWLDLWSMPNHCGSELARDGSVSVDIHFDALPLSRAGSLLQGMLVVGWICGRCRAIVGASLLAMAACQSTSILNVLPLSRAGSLLQGMLVVGWICGRCRTIVGASLLAMAACQSTSILMPCRYREQARSYRGCWLLAGCVVDAEPLWERACSRWQRVSRHPF